MTTNDPTSLFSLEGVTAAVVGASSGIGRSLSLAYARAGATVYAAARRVDRLEELASEAPDGRIIPHEVDVCRESDVAGFIDRIEQDGRVATVVLNAAGLFSYTPPPIPDEEFAKVLDVNLMGTWRVLLAFGEHLKRANRPGSLITIGSSCTTFTVAPSNHAYFASKGGVENLVRWMAADLAESDIRVNLIAPGWIETDMVETALSREGRVTILEEHTPLKRIGTTEDVTGAGLFLASEASRYVTGITLLVDGGLALNRVWNIRPT